MISKIGGSFLPFFILMGLLGGSASAADVPELGSDEPSVILEKIVALLVAQADDLKKGLTSLKNLSPEREALKEEHLDFLEEILDYYNSLEITEANVKELATELIDRRESVHSEKLREISDFLLVFQAKSILGVAENRFVKIHSDLNRLIDLKILEEDKPRALLNNAHLLLVGAAELIGQSESLISTTTKARLEIRDLISEAVVKIKSAYKKFLEISSLLKESLK